MVGVGGDRLGGGRHGRGSRENAGGLGCAEEAVALDGRMGGLPQDFVVLVGCLCGCRGCCDCYCIIASLRRLLDSRNSLWDPFRVPLASSSSPDHTDPINAVCGPLVVRGFVAARHWGQHGRRGVSPRLLPPPLPRCLLGDVVGWGGRGQSFTSVPPGRVF